MGIRCFCRYGTFEKRGQPKGGVVENGCAKMFIQSGRLAFYEIIYLQNYFQVADQRYCLQKRQFHNWFLIVFFSGIVYNTIIFSHAEYIPKACPVKPIIGCTLTASRTKHAFRVFKQTRQWSKEGRPHAGAGSASLSGSYISSHIDGHTMATR